MDFFRALDISASGLDAHRKRMDVIAENLANSDATVTRTGRPYQRKVVLLESVDGTFGSFGAMLGRADTPDGSVRVRSVSESNEP